MNIEPIEKNRIDFDTGEFYNENGISLDVKEFKHLNLSLDFLFEKTALYEIFENNRKDFEQVNSRGMLYTLKVFYKEKGTKLVLNESKNFLEVKNVTALGIRAVYESDKYLDESEYILGFIYKVDGDSKLHYYEFENDSHEILEEMYDDLV